MHVYVNCVQYVQYTCFCTHDLNNFELAWGRGSNKSCFVYTVRADCLSVFADCFIYLLTGWRTYF
jgi:hypothetical protein